jgi:hypothetical protein
MTLRVYAHVLTHLDRRIAGTMASVIDGPPDLTVINGEP